VEPHLGRHVIDAGLTDFGLPDTAFPHLLLIRQTEVEAVLLAASAERVLHVEWDTAFETYRLDSEKAIGTVGPGGEPEHTETRFFVGADGSPCTPAGCPRRSGPRLPGARRLRPPTR